MKRVAVLVSAFLVAACSFSASAPQRAQAANPETVKAIAIIEGTKEYTVNSMRHTFADRFKIWASVHPSAKLEQDIRELDSALDDLEKYLGLLKKAADAGAELAPEQPRILGIYVLLGKANEPFFRIAQAIITAEHN